MEEQNKISLEQIELRTRRILDEINAMVILLCKKLYEVNQENEKLKNYKPKK